MKTARQASAKRQRGFLDDIVMMMVAIKLCRSLAHSFVCLEIWWPFFVSCRGTWRAWQECIASQATPEGRKIVSSTWGTRIFWVPRTFQLGFCPPKKFQFNPAWLKSDEYTYLGVIFFAPCHVLLRSSFYGFLLSYGRFGSGGWSPWREQRARGFGARAQRPDNLSIVVQYDASISC